MNRSRIDSARLEILEARIAEARRAMPDVADAETGSQDARDLLAIRDLLNRANAKAVGLGLRHRKGRA